MDRLDCWVRSNETAAKCQPVQIRVKYEAGRFKVAALRTDDLQRRLGWKVKAVGLGVTLADAIENLCDAVGARH